MAPSSSARLLLFVYFVFFPLSMVLREYHIFCIYGVCHEKPLSHVMGNNNDSGFCTQHIFKPFARGWMKKIKKAVTLLSKKISDEISVTTKKKHWPRQMINRQMVDLLLCVNCLHVSSETCSFVEEFLYTLD